MGGRDGKIIALLPKVPALLSLLGSGCITTCVLRSKTRTPYHRLLLGLSLFDILGSIGHFLSTWPIPRGTPGVWGASGNTATCSAQGILIHLGGTVPMYNTALAVYYLLITRYRWTEERVHSIEPLLHITSFGTPLITSVILLRRKMFNSAYTLCWIASFPMGCKESYKYGDKANCVRGDNARIYRWAIGFIPVWICIFVATTCLALVYWTVLQKERAVDKFQEDGVFIRTQSKRVLRQAVAYVLAFYVTWIWPTLYQLLLITETSGIFSALVGVLVGIFLPIQGFLNFWIFAWSRYLTYKRETPGATRVEALLYAAFNHKTHRVQTKDSTAQDVPSSTVPSKISVLTENILNATTCTVSNG